jgi:acylpyruvate hydrolase
LQVPPKCSELHYEVELGVVIGKEGKNIPESSAMSHIGGYTLALDMTARNIQSAAKKKGHPWSVAKGYDTFCPVSNFISKESIALDNTRLWLKVDGQLKQDGNTKDMVFSIPYLISYISQIFSLEVGDVILTGTPEGVGPVKPGQVITAGVEGLIEMTFPVKEL